MQAQPSWLGQALRWLHLGLANVLHWTGTSKRRVEVVLTGTGAAAELRRAFIASWMYGVDEWLGSTAQCGNGRACVVPRVGQDLHISNVGLGEPSHFGLLAAAGEFNKLMHAT